MRWGRRLTSSPTEGSSLACGLPIHQHEKRGLPCCSTGAARHKHSPPKPAARSRLIIGDFGPSDSALAAARGWRLRRPAADRHAARCASRDLCSGGAPRRYPPSGGGGRLISLTSLHRSNGCEYLAHDTAIPKAATLLPSVPLGLR